MELLQENIAQSDDESEGELSNIRKRRNRSKILDSDSDNEDQSSVKKVESVEDRSVGNNNKNKTQRISLVTENGLEEERNFEERSDNTESVSPCERQAKKGNNDSDIEESVEEEEITLHNKSFPDEETAVETVIYVTNNKGELIQENANQGIKKASLSALCDSESSDDDSNIIEETYIDEPVIKPIVYKPSRKKKIEDKPKMMTPQEAARQKIEIQSDSQRRLRESNATLPYHKPKSHTIKEFLEKRSKLASALPTFPKAPPSVAIKMTRDQLEEVSKKLNERIKEVEEFYKSESDEDEDETTHDDPSDDIRGLLFALVDNAVDTVETRLKAVEENAEDSGKNESMEYEFSLDDVNELEVSKHPKISELPKEKLSIRPKLSGTPDDIIDLDEGVARPSDVKKLVEKFYKNAVQKAPHKHKVELNVVGVGAHGEIVKETVSMNVDEEEEPAMIETPGAKLQRLREELQLQMAQKRLELWKQKHEQGDRLITQKKREPEDEQKDILDDEDEEFEVTESESEDTDEEDEEDEENECEDGSEKGIKSAFIDDEASEDDEVEELEDNNDYNRNEEEPKKTELGNSKKKTLRRILKPFTEDSDEESQDFESTKVLKYYTTDEDYFIPPNLPRVGKTPQRTQAEKNKSEFDFLTPITYLTGLQILNSDSKFTNSSSQDVSLQPHVQKNLFPGNSQDNVDDLAQICSDTFPETQVQSLEGNLAEKMPPTTQELLNVCSGDFGSVSTTNRGSKSPEKEGTNSEITEERPPTTQDLLNMCSGDFSTLNTVDNDEKSKETSDKILINLRTNGVEEIKNLDEEHDQIISQLLDEDELERFKKKFESPINAATRKNEAAEEVDEVNATGVIDSDDEDEKNLEIKTKKKQKKLVFSDDEGDESGENQDVESSEDEESVGDEEQIDLHDSDNEEQRLENEIIQQQSVNYQTSDFLDKEAELSESEWGSADEDERDLDEFEVEEGDGDKINEKKLRRELERMHMRNLLDDDNREVKLLQELLLEDGELHGTGRKRQFRWKALDSTDNGEFDKRDDDDIFLDEEENEEQYRKMRHKREMFLKKKLDAEDDDSILADSQILKVGQQIFKNKSFNSQNDTPVSKSEDVNEPFTLTNKRGSFLSRRDQVLQRLAEYTKVTDTVGNTVAKNSKSFVFQSVGVNGPIDLKNNNNNNKRKATEGTPKVLKKLRLSDLSPAVDKGVKSSRAKKLFGNW